MLRRLLAAVVAGLCASCAATPPSGAVSVSPADLRGVVGSDWKGTLTYRDYSPPYGAVTLSVEASIAPTPNGISVALHYPKEPQADGANELSLSDGGRTLDGDMVTGREVNGDTLTITTKATCEDDDKVATCVHIYTLAPKAFGWRKLVTFEGSSQAIQRNAYAFAR